MAPPTQMPDDIIWGDVGTLASYLPRSLIADDPLAPTWFRPAGLGPVAGGRWSGPLPGSTSRDQQTQNHP
jgi:hypothetical protein